MWCGLLFCPPLRAAVSCGAAGACRTWVDAVEPACCSCEHEVTMSRCAEKSSAPRSARLTAHRHSDRRWFCSRNGPRPWSTVNQNDPRVLKNVAADQAITQCLGDARCFETGSEGEPAPARCRETASQESKIYYAWYLSCKYVRNAIDGCEVTTATTHLFDNKEKRVPWNREEVFVLLLLTSHHARTCADRLTPLSTQ